MDRPAVIHAQVRDDPNVLLLLRRIRCHPIVFVEVFGTNLPLLDNSIGGLSLIIGVRKLTWSLFIVSPLVAIIPITIKL